MDLEKGGGINSFMAGKRERRTEVCELQADCFGARRHYLHDLIHLLYTEDKAHLTEAL